MVILVRITLRYIDECRRRTTTAVCTFTTYVVYICVPLYLNLPNLPANRIICRFEEKDCNATGHQLEQRRNRLSQLLSDEFELYEQELQVNSFLT